MVSRGSPVNRVFDLSTRAAGFPVLKKGKAPAMGLGFAPSRTSLLGSALPFVGDSIRRCYLPRASAWSQPLPNALEKDIERRDREDADEGREDHSAKHRRADIASGRAPTATTSG